MAIEFSGTNQNVSRTSGVVGFDVAQRTVAFWFWADATGTGQVIFTSASSLASGQSADTVSTNAPAASGFRLFYQFRWTVVAGWQVNTDLSTGQWYHVAVTYDRGATTNDPTIYVNGISAAFTETTAPSGTAKTGQVAYRFGEAAAGTADFDGRVSDFGWWDRLLSAAEVAALAKGYAPSFFCRGLRLDMPFTGRHSPEPERRQGAAGTVTGATYVDGPRIIRPMAA
jgi:hypothetical protein